MKPPSKNVSASIGGQMHGSGRSPEPIAVTGKGSSRPTMTVPGEGRVQDAPGGGNSRDSARSACNYVTPQKRYMGG